jgi:CheY-like chemotaxis protein
MNVSEVISIASISIAVLSVVWQYFGGILSLRKEMEKDCLGNLEAHAKLDRELRELILNQALKINSAETKMELFWNAIGSSIKDLIKQPIHIEKDTLMDKLMDNPKTITNQEIYRLKAILIPELTELKLSKNPSCIAYAFTLAYIEQLLFDRAHIELPSTITAKKILLIDDDVQLLNILKYSISKEFNFTVLCASNGEDALNIIKKNKDIGIIFVDLIMPGMDGYETIRCIKTFEESKHIPVIAYTGKDICAEDHPECIRADIAGTLIKPLSIKQMLDTINDKAKWPS